MMTQAMQSPITAFCPRCGGESPFTLHNERVVLQKKITIQPILPTCVACGAAVLLPAPPMDVCDRRMIILTGTCASGKSTTAEMLISRHGFSGIDGNNVMDVVRYKFGTTHLQFNGEEVLLELGHEIDILLSLHKDIVLSHVIIPDDLPKYRKIMRDRALQYRIFVLQPDYATAVARSKTRTCFSDITDERWIKHFHDELSAFRQQDHPDVVIVDNTHCSAEEAADRIVRLYHDVHPSLRIDE